MGKSIKNVSLVILLLKMCIIFSQDLAPKKRIVIDPGHGGRDSGAIGINGIQEKDVVLNIAKEIVKLNHTLFNDEFDIYLTRYRDTLISLSDRTKLARQLNADIFISLHCNHSANPRARGMEIYVANTKSDYLEESIYLSYLLQKGFRDKLSFESRGVKFGNFQVLRKGIQFFPIILLEFGFLSNIIDSNYLSNNDNYILISASFLNSI